MTGGRVERRLAAVLAADVAGYSRLMGADEVGTLTALKTLRRDIVDPAIAEHKGRIVKTTGDGMLVEFASAVDAVTCAMDVQGKMAERNGSTTHGIAFRIGINVGDIIIDDDDIFGDGVNVAARVENECQPGGVCLSGTAFEQIRGKTRFAFDDLGEKALKNIDRPMRLFAARVGTPSSTANSSAEGNKSLPLPDKPSIAVLPFQNMSGDPEQEYFADGMVEEIITALARNRQLFVIARNSSFAFKGKAVDIKQVARDLGVRYVLEGSVRKSGNRVRITGQLIDAASGAHLWADRFDGALEDIFEFQDQVAANVAGAIDPSVARAEWERAKRKPTESLEAYDYYLRGAAAHFQYTRESNKQAIELLEQAVALDPHFAIALSQLAAVLNTRHTWRWSADPRSDASRAVSYAKRALHLEPQNPLVLAQSALVHFASTGEVELADSLSEEAIRLDPNNLSGWLWGGWAKMLLGDHQTALSRLQRALRLSPLDPRIFFVNTALAYAHFFLGNHKEGLRCATEALHYRADYVASLRAAMACSAFSGNVGAAQDYWRQLALLSPRERVSDLRKRLSYRREQDLKKLEEAYRLAGMPE